MKLQDLSAFELLNSEDLYLILGGSIAIAKDSEAWADSTSRDCYKKDVGGNSKKRDTAAPTLSQ